MATVGGLYLLYGPDGFSAREELRRLREALDTQGSLEHNTNRFDARREAIKVSDVLLACNTVSFFAESRLVIVEGLLERLGGGRRRTSKARKPGDMSEADRLYEGLANLPASTMAVFIEDNATKTTVDAFAAIGAVRFFQVLKGAEVRTWAQTRVEAAGARIMPPALARLADLIDGYHLGELAQEIEKLALYANGRTIDVDDVDALVSVAVQYQVWDLTDAVAMGRADRALRVLQRMDEKQQPRQLLFAMLVRQYRQMLQVKAGQSEGMTDADVGREFGIGFPFPYSKLVDQAKRYQGRRLDDAYRKLFEADVAVKTGVLDIDLALEMVIVDMSTIVAGAGSASFRRD